MKKISNLLILALLTIGMGLTSCDEMLDNAVDPGVMPDVEVTSIALNASGAVATRQLQLLTRLVSFMP